MSTIENYQGRLVQLQRDFNKVVYTANAELGQWVDFVIEYKGEEVLDGVLNEDKDIFVKQVGKIAGQTLIKVSLKCNNVGVINKKLTIYFDDRSPFYIRTEKGKIEVTDRKLKTQITFQINVVLNFDKVTYDCGNHNKNDKVGFEFTYLGKESIKGVKGSCGCTDVQFEGNRIFGTIDTKDFKTTWAKNVTVYFGEFERPYESDGGIFVPSTKVHNVALSVKGQVQS